MINTRGGPIRPPPGSDRVKKDFIEMAPLGNSAEGSTHSKRQVIDSIRHEGVNVAGTCI